MTGKHLWIYSSEAARDTDAQDTKPNGLLEGRKHSRASGREGSGRYKQAGTQFPQTSGCSLERNDCSPFKVLFLADTE